MTPVSIAGVVEHSIPLIDHTTGEAHDIKVYCGFHRTDAGNALRLIAYYGDDIRYCATTNTWYIWNGKYWEIDLKNKIFELAKDTARLIHAEITFAEGNTKEAKFEREELSKWAFQSEAMYRLKAMVTAAQSDPHIAVSLDQFDANPYLLSCETGTIDFLNCPREHPWREHRREDLITQFTPRNHNPEANGEKWYETLFGALPVESVFYCQDLAGYSCILTAEEKAFVYVYGIPDGRKSTIIDAIFAALGDYGTAFDYRTFQKSYDSPSGPRPDIIDLEKKRAGRCSELPKDFVINDALMKSVSSANVKRVRGLFEKHGHDAVIRATLWFESNFMAKIDFEDDANYNRLNVLVFNRPLNIVDKKMLGFLQTDPEMQDAIFTWTIDGAYEFLEHGLKKPAIVDAATHQYQRMMNPLNWFLNEFCIKDETARTPASEVYERFKHVAELLPLELRASVKKELRGQKSFNKTFKKLVNFTRFNDRMYYLGIKIPLIWSEIDDEDEDVYMRKLSVDSADCVDSEGNFQKSLRNILAYRDFRKKYIIIYIIYIFKERCLCFVRACA